MIIAWAIFFIGRDRIKYEKTISSAEQNAIVVGLNRLEAHRKINEDRLNLTFNLHLQQISKICVKLGIHNDIGPNSRKDIEEFAASIKEEIDSLPSHYSVAEDKELADEIIALKHARSEFGQWRNYSFACEIAFLVIGTLQSGYGAALSESLAKIGITNFLNSLSIHF